MNRTPATAQQAAKIAAKLAKALAKAVDLTPCARARRLSADATAYAKAAKVAADYSAIVAGTPEAQAEAIANAFAFARLVGRLATEAEAAARHLR